MVKSFVMMFTITLMIFITLMYLFQRHLIYFPNKTPPRLQDFHATNWQMVSFRTQDHLTLKSWYKPAIKNQPTILFLHGNAGHIGHRIPLVNAFTKQGIGVLLLEYRGYGGNKGTPTESGLYEDARAGLHFLYQQGVTYQTMVVYGESLGTGVATKLAEEHPFCGVVLQSPFISLTSLANHHYPWMFLKPWDQFNSLERIQRIHSPILVLHGKADDIVPFKEGLTLFNQANDPKQMHAFEHYNHNDLWRAPHFSEKVIQFIQTHCPG